MIRKRLWPFAMLCGLISVIWIVEIWNFNSLYENVFIIARTNTYELIKLAIGYGAAFLLTALLVSAIGLIPWIGPLAAGFFVTLAVGSNFAFCELLKNHAGIADLNSLRHSPIETTIAAITSFYSAKIGFFYVFAALVGFGAFFVFQQRKDRSVRLFLGVAFAALALNIGFWSAVRAANKMISVYPFEPLSNTVRMVSIDLGEEVYFNRIERNKVDASLAEQKTDKPKDNILLIIDESIRYDFVSLFNPEAGTTPFLESLRKKGDLTPLGLTISVGTASFSADMLLLTGTHQIPDNEKTVLKNPTLFDVAKAFGYETTLVDVPSSNFPSVFIREKDMRNVDHHVKGSQFKGQETFLDMGAADYIYDLLSRSTGNFVVLYKLGSHFHYESTYPSSEPKYQKNLPKLGPTDSYAAPRELIVNSYKNSIAFTVDEFSTRLFKQHLSSTTVFYTSDHGQSLREDDSTTATHGGTALVQALVPTFIVSDHPWAQDSQWKARMASVPLLSHHHIYPSIISLMSGKKDFHNGPFYSLFAEDFLSHPFTPTYFQGNVFFTENIFPVTLDQVKPFIKQAH